METTVLKPKKTDVEMTFLEELQDLLDFLRSLWGILAGVTIFFPLSTAFFHLVPVEYRWETDGWMRGFSYFQPQLVILITTLMLIFVMFWLVSHRAQFKLRRRHAVQRRAFRAFTLGIVSLLVYLTAYEAASDLTNSLKIYRGNPAIIPGDLILLISYAGFFVSLTVAFMLLGMIEYYEQKAKRTALDEGKVDKSY